MRAAVAQLLMCIGLLSAGCRISSAVAQRLAPPLARSSGGSFATSDTYLRTLEIGAPSERVRSLISTLPEYDSIMFIAPDQSAETELVYRTIASLSWPHEIGAVHCATAGVAPTTLFLPRSSRPIRWGLLYRLAPASLQAVVAEIGPHLRLVRIEGESDRKAEEWTSYCSR